MEWWRTPFVYQRDVTAHFFLTPSKYHAQCSLIGSFSNPFIWHRTYTQNQQQQSYLQELPVGNILLMVRHFVLALLTCSILHCLKRVAVTVIMFVFAE